MAGQARILLHNELVSIMAEEKLWKWDPFNFYNGNITEDILNQASNHVYFQPPDNTAINNPCIIYKISDGDTRFADNLPYVHKVRYQITVVDDDPDSTIPDRIAKLQMCIRGNRFISDGLYHDIFYKYC